MEVGHLGRRGLGVEGHQGVDGHAVGQPRCLACVVAQRLHVKVCQRVGGSRPHEAHGPQEGVVCRAPRAENSGGMVVECEQQLARKGVPGGPHAREAVPRGDGRHTVGWRKGAERIR